jgi:hypothetical protein
LKERLAKKGIKYEILTANEEIFMHYEDAIPYNELKAIKGENTVKVTWAKSL